MGCHYPGKPLSLLIFGLLGTSLLQQDGLTQSQSFKNY
jgi:hypothetical protein